MNLDRVIAVRNTKTVYRDGDLCIKVFNASVTKADVLNEALNQARIEETGLRIPAIRDVAQVGDKWAIVSDYITGETLAARMAKEPEKRDLYLEMLVDLQLQVHSRTCPLLNRLTDQMDRRIMQAELPATLRYDLLARIAEMPKHHKICHGDFTPSNIILTEKDGPYILDWSHATQGNGSADAARTYLQFRLREGDDTAETYLDLFNRKSGTEMPYIRAWIPIAAAAESAGTGEADRVRLLKWAQE